MLTVVAAEVAGVVEAVGFILQATPSCPGCIEMSSPTLISGMLVGMVLLLAAPFLVIFGIGGGLFRARRRALAEAEQQEEPGG